jgi:molybdate/tungstate transport system permease protein
MKTRSAGRRAVFALALGVPAVIMVLFLAVPLWTLLSRTNSGSVRSTIQAPDAMAAIKTSLISTSVATVLLTILGVPLAYILARYKFRGRGLIGGLVYLPLVFPPIVAGILLLFTYSGSGPVGQYLEPHGIIFVDQLSGIVVAQMFVSAPFIIIAARSAFEGLDDTLLDAARAAGADGLRVFWSIAVPLSRRAIFAGIALSWMRAFGEFGATVIMTYFPQSFPVYMYNQWEAGALRPLLPLSLLAVVMGAVTLVVIAVIERFDVVPRFVRRAVFRPAAASPR